MSELLLVTTIFIKNISWTTSKIFPARRFFKIKNRWRRFIVFIVNLEQVSDIVLVFLLLTWQGRLSEFPDLFGKVFLVALKFSYFNISKIPGEWELSHKIPYVGPRAGIPNQSLGTRPLYQGRDHMTQNIQVGLRTRDPLFYFTRNSSNHSVTYTQSYYDLSLVLK